ncbi:MAG: hypothetical protein AABX61_03150 [Nanoarchaeota archaeon]
MRKTFKLIYNLFILIMLIIGIIKLVQKEYYLAFIWIIFTPIIMILPRNLYKINWINHKYNKKLLDLFEIFILILLFTGAGLPLGLKYLPFDIDSYFHFLNGVSLTILFGIVYYIIKNRITGREINKREIVLFAFISYIIFGVILWEKFQYYNDQIFGTKMFFDYFQDVNYDSMLDQIFGSLGNIFGSILIYFNFDNWLNKWRA